ncbi:hypothetical protein oki101_06060 [Helicobacter pylori]
MKGLKSESSGDQQKEKDQTPPQKREFKKRKALKKKDFKKKALKEKL